MARTVLLILLLGGFCATIAVFLIGGVTWWSLVIGVMFLIFAIPFTVKK